MAARGLHLAVLAALGLMMAVRFVVVCGRLSLLGRQRAKARVAAWLLRTT
jgi:hypothetical protein